MGREWKKLDNTAKLFSLANNQDSHVFRLSAVLTENIDPSILKEAVIKTTNDYPYYKTREKTGFFWNYLTTNKQEPIIHKEKGTPCRRINFYRNNGYLFKVTYFKNKINVDIFHILTDGVGGTFLLKNIIYNYLNIKYKLTSLDKEKEFIDNQDIDNYLKIVEKNAKDDYKYNKVYRIKDPTNYFINKTFHYIVDLKILKEVCKEKDTSITEFFTALYIKAIYESIYDIKCQKDIVMRIPIDLRRRYNTNALENFFTYTNIRGNVVNKEHLDFDDLLNFIHSEFKEKITDDNVKNYLARDVKIGMNIAIRLIPLFIKKIGIEHLSCLVNQNSTSVVSNLGPIKLERKYEKYVKNIFALTSPSKSQKAKLTISSYNNLVTITLNTNIISNKLESKMKELLEKHLGKIYIESNMEEKYAISKTRNKSK